MFSWFKRKVKCDCSPKGTQDVGSVSSIPNVQGMSICGALCNDLSLHPERWNYQFQYSPSHSREFRSKTSVCAVKQCEDFVTGRIYYLVYDGHDHLDVPSTWNITLDKIFNTADLRLKEVVKAHAVARVNEELKKHFGEC
jgi:hypothetical protein